ncbi:MAG: hypothetical protein JNL79_21370 [Myxococcales bacterium]|nr:hypothetical protein [Myxococcales bacterium]
MRLSGLTQWRRGARGVSAGALLVLGSLLAVTATAQPLPPLPPDLAKQLPPGVTIPGLGGPTGVAVPTGTAVPGLPANIGALPPPVMSPQPGIAEWTVLVYAVADNDLEGPILDDLDEMERVGSVKGVNVVMEIDRWRPPPGSPMASRDDKTNGDWDTARRYFVTRDDGSIVINSKLLSDMGEIDMSHPKELKDFIAWGVKNFPAKRYALVMEDHGNAWLGGFIDDKAPPETHPMMMTLPELQSGLAAGLKEAGLAKFDLLATDACLMGTLEVADAIAPYVKYWAASEELQPGAGYEYTQALAPLVQKPALMDGAALGKSFVNAMRVSYGPGAKGGPDPTITSALFDMSKIPALRAAVDTMASQIAGNMEASKLGMGTAAESADTFGPRTDPINGPRDGFADLVQVAAVIREMTTASNVKASAQSVITALDAARVDKFNGDDRINARGLSIWLPPPDSVKKLLPAYQKTPFGKTSPWSTALQTYSNAFSVGAAPKITNIQIGKNAGNPFGGERPVTATVDGDISNVIMIVSQDFLGNKVPVEVVGITDPALFKKLAEGPGVTTWKKTGNMVSTKWTPMYATLSGKGGIEFPLSVHKWRFDATSFDTDVGLRILGGPEETVMLRFSFAKGVTGYAGSKLLTGYFIDQVKDQTFYTPFTPAKLPAAKVAFEPRYQIVDPSGKSSTLKLPLQVKWDKVEDLKVNVRPMLPGTYQITIMAEDFSGHVGVAKATTTLP